MSWQVGENVEIKVSRRLLQPIAKLVIIFVGHYHILVHSVAIISCNISDWSHFYSIGCNIIIQGFCLQT